MEFLIASATALLMTGFVTASTEKANAVVYCQYVHYPANCVAGLESPCVRAVSRELPRVSSEAWNTDEIVAVKSIALEGDDASAS